MIVVTGASGQLGRRIVEQLLKRAPDTRIGVSVRDPEKVADLAARGVRVRRADYSDAASLRTAFEGATQVLLISSNDRKADPVAQHRTAVEVVKAAGAKRVVYTSQISSSPTSAFIPGITHGKTEAVLRESGLPFTALRNGFYATTALGFLENAIKAGELIAPEDGKFSWTGHDDLAEAAATVLMNDGRFDGATPPLTGSESLDFTDLAALASKLAGKDIKRITITDDEYVARMVKAGTPEMFARFSLGMFVAARRGEFSEVNPALEQLVGHRPMTVATLAASVMGSITES